MLLSYDWLLTAKMCRCTGFPNKVDGETSEHSVLPQIEPYNRKNTKLLRLQYLCYTMCSDAAFFSHLDSNNLTLFVKDVNSRICTNDKAMLAN